MAYWLKLGYFTEAVGAGDADFWRQRSWVSDGPGRKSRYWEKRARPRWKGKYPPHGPRYRVGDHLIIYLKGRGCPAILRVIEEPHWDPRWVDENGSRGEGDRWGVVTQVECVGAVALLDAPKLNDIGVEPAEVMSKGHIGLEEWKYRLAEARIGGARLLVPQAPKVTQIPIEQGKSEGYEVSPVKKTRAAWRREARLVRDYAGSMEEQGDVVERNMSLPSMASHPIYTDVFNLTRNQLIEAKAGTSRNEIRLAIGQLADYGRFVATDARKGCCWRRGPIRTFSACSSPWGSRRSGAAGTAFRIVPAGRSRSPSRAMRELSSLSPMRSGRGK